MGKDLPLARTWDEAARTLPVGELEWELYLAMRWLEDRTRDSFPILARMTADYYEDFEIPPDQLSALLGEVDLLSSSPEFATKADVLRMLDGLRNIVRQARAAGVSLFGAAD